MRTLLLLVALSTGCPQPSESGDASTGPGVCSAAGCACEDVCNEGLVCASQICVPITDASSSSGGEPESTGTNAGSTGALTDPGSTGSTGTTDDSSGGVASTTEASSSSASTSTGPVEPYCGDGAVDEGEECDDGNADPGDGCDVVCSTERWEHEGVALGVPVADLVKWELCWSGSYGAGDQVSSITEACKGDHLMMACRPVGAEYLTVAAHAPREDVMFPVDYGAGERHEANGVAWYWSPTSNIEGFAPAGNTDGCEGNTDGVQASFLCWVNAADEPLTFQVGRRCSTNDINGDEAEQWERLLFQSWD